MSLSEDLSNSTLGGNFFSNDTTPWDLIQCRATSIVPVTILVLTVLLGVPGNGAVAWVMGFKMKRSVHTVCFLNLAVADLTYCLFLPVLVAVYCRPSFFLITYFWILLGSIFIFYTSASVFLLTLISISRCLAVTRPIWFQQHLSLAWVRAGCFGAWGLAFLMCLTELLLEQIYQYIAQYTGAVLEVTWALFVFGLPIVIMATCYLLIVRKLHRDKLAKSRKPFRLLVTVLTAFIICWLPYTVCRLVYVFGKSVPRDWTFFTISLASFNSALNPFLYVFVGRDFHKVFRRSLAASLRLAFAEDAELGNIPPNLIATAETSS